MRGELGRMLSVRIEITGRERTSQLSQARQPNQDDSMSRNRGIR